MDLYTLLPTDNYLPEKGVSTKAEFHIQNTEYRIAHELMLSVKNNKRNVTVTNYRGTWTDLRHGTSTSTSIWILVKILDKVLVFRSRDAIRIKGLKLLFIGLRKKVQHVYTMYSFGVTYMLYVGWTATLKLSRLCRLVM